MAESSKVSPALEKAIDKLMKEVMNSAEASLTDKMKVIDRALKLEALKAKLTDSGFGSGFHDDED